MNEIEVYYLQRSAYKERKNKQYKEQEEAMEIFDKTIKKFKGQRIEALVVFRIFERGLWRTVKTERT